MPVQNSIVPNQVNTLSGNRKLRRSLKKAAAITFTNQKEWNQRKSRWYGWAKVQAHNKGIRTPELHFLEAIISCSNLAALTQATVKSLIANYKKRHPNHPISRSTAFRYLAFFQELNLIKNYGQQGHNQSAIRRLLVPETKSVNSSVSSWDTNILSENKIDIDAGGKPPFASLNSSSPPLYGGGGTTEEQRQHAKLQLLAAKALLKI